MSVDFSKFEDTSQIMNYLGRDPEAQEQGIASLLFYPHYVVPFRSLVSSILLALGKVVIATVELGTVALLLDDREVHAAADTGFKGEGVWVWEGGGSNPLPKPQTSLRFGEGGGGESYTPVQTPNKFEVWVRERGSNPPSPNWKLVWVCPPSSPVASTFRRGTRENNYFTVGFVI